MLCFSRIKTLVVCSALVFCLQGCGGGGGDNKPLTNSPQSSDNMSSSQNTSSAIAVSSATSSEVSSAASSASSTPANAKTIQVSGQVTLQDLAGEVIDIEDPASVKVSVSLVNAEQITVATKTLELADIAGMKPGMGMPFSTNLNLEEGHFAVIHITKKGYTDFARRFEAKANISFNATLSEVPSSEIQANSAETISGQVITGFNFSVIKNDDGQTVYESETGVIPALSVSIPESILPAGTESVDVKMQAFDPNNVTEAAYFPGAYEDSTGNKLLSVAFNYTEVTTDTGTSLKTLGVASRNKRLAAEKAGAKLQKPAAEELVIINRSIPAESCLSLSQLGDSDAATSGFQIPVYTYNPTSGLWDLLGHGTVYTANGEVVDESFTEFNCEETTYVLEIHVSSEIFISNWWNLDYPLVFEEPIKLCATIALKNSEGLPAAGNTIFINDDDTERSFSAEYFVTDENGIAHINVYALSNDIDTSAKLTIYADGYAQNIHGTVQLSTNCANVTPTELQVELPAMCRVEGAFNTTAGEPVANAWVFAFNPENQNMSAMPAFGETNQQGRYSLNVTCDQNYNIGEYMSLLMSSLQQDSANKMATFNINNQLSADEQSDDGSKVVMATRAVSYDKPFAIVTSDETSQTTLSLTFYHANNNYPLHYEFDVTDPQTNAMIGHFEGTVTRDDITSGMEDSGWLFDIGNVSIQHQLPIADTFPMYSVTGTISDAKNNAGNMIGFIYLSEDE